MNEKLQYETLGNLKLNLIYNITNIVISDVDDASEQNLACGC